MEFKGKDFNADKPRQHEAVRGVMVKMNSCTALFSPADIPYMRLMLMRMRWKELKKKEELVVRRKSIKVTRERIMEKIKKIRQSFSNAFTNGTRSGSGKIVPETL